MRGYFEIGVFHCKTHHNIGTLWRSAYQLGASGIFTIGRRYRKQSSDTLKVPGLIPLRHFVTMDDYNRPHGAVLIGVEMSERSIPLAKFSHPMQAVYLLGAEDHGLPQYVMDMCNQVVSVESVRASSFNVAVAGSLVMYSRLLQGMK